MSSASNAGVRVEVRGLSREHHKAGNTIRVLSGVDLTLAAGDRVAIVGPSGSGKSTFLQIIGLLDHPSSGSVALDGEDAFTLSQARRSQIRNRKVGFVFQSHNLLPEHTALGNVMIPVRLAGGSTSVAEARAKALLRAVGLSQRMLHRPGELSGGEQQRVALARAMVMGPGLVLADEPTGNLDPNTALGVFDLMLQLNAQLGSTMVVVTHSLELARRFPRTLVLDAGRFKDV